MNKEKSFEDLYDSFKDQVYRFALRLCSNKDDAEDLAAETFAEAFRSWDRYRGESTAKVWLFSILLNRWKMFKRKNRVPTHNLAAIETIASTFSFDGMELAQAVLSLPEPLKEAFLLVKGEGLTVKEAARVRGVPAGTMSFRVFSAIQRLRHDLLPKGGQYVSMGVNCDQEV